MIYTAVRPCSSVLPLTCNMEQFLDKDYVMVSSENFEEFLVFTGVSFIARKAAGTLKPIQCLCRNADGSYTFKFKSKLMNSDITFKLGEEFDEKRQDGSGMVVKSVVTIEDGNKLIHVQTDPKGAKITHVREFFPDKMVVTSTADGFDKTTIRTYKLVE